MALPPTTTNDVMEWNDTNIFPFKKRRSRQKKQEQNKAKKQELNIVK